MSVQKSNSLLWIVPWSLFMLLGCTSETHKKAIEKDKKVTRVFYLNSYQSSYSLGKKFTKTIEERAKENKLKLIVYFLSASSSDTPQQKAQKTIGVIQEINQFKPEVIIVSEDPGVERVIVPQLQQLDVPIIFTGVDWSARSYGLPPQKVIGMIDRPDLNMVYLNKAIVQDSISAIHVIGGNSEINRRAISYLTQWASNQNKDIVFNWANDIKQWGILFQEAQRENGLVLLLHEEGISDWDADEAEYIVSQYIKQPIVAFSSTLKKCAVFTYTASENEQANWAMDTALSAYSVSKGSAAQVSEYLQFYKPSLLEKINLAVDSTWIQSATEVK